MMAIISISTATSAGFRHNPINTLSGGGRRCKYTGEAVVIHSFTVIVRFIALAESDIVLCLEQRALPMRIITVGKKRSPGVQLLLEDYTNKLKNHCPVDHVQIRSNPRNARDERAQVDDEDKAVMNLIGSDDWVVMLDEHGRDIGSEEMVELIGDAGNTGGASRLLFCIGGPYGHGQQMRRRANVSIRLSSMVLNHQIALLVLVEQLYRSWTILKGQNYHH